MTIILAQSEKRQKRCNLCLLATRGPPFLFHLGFQNNSFPSLLACCFLAWKCVERHIAPFARLTAPVQWRHEIRKKEKPSKNEDIHRSLFLSFFNLVAPSNNPRSTAAATVSVPPTMAQRPATKPRKVLARSSRLMTFMGEMSCQSMLATFTRLPRRRKKHAIQETVIIRGCPLTYEKKTPGIPPLECNLSACPSAASSPPARLLLWLVTEYWCVSRLPSWPCPNFPSSA